MYTCQCRVCFDHSGIYFVHTIIMSPRSVCCRAFCSTFDFSRSPSCSTNGRTMEIVKVPTHPLRIAVANRRTWRLCTYIQIWSWRTEYSCSMYAHTTKCLSQDLLFIIHHRAVSDECHPPIMIDNWTYSGYRRARAGLLRII